MAFQLPPMSPLSALAQPVLDSCLKASNDFREKLLGWNSPGDMVAGFFVNKMRAMLLEVDRVRVVAEKCEAESLKLIEHKRLELEKAETIRKNLEAKLDKTVVCS